MAEKLKLGASKTNKKKVKTSAYKKVTGKIFWNRTWDYNDETRAGVKIKEYLPEAKAIFYFDLNSGEKYRKAVYLGENGDFLLKRIPNFKKLSIKVVLRRKHNKVVKVVGQKFNGNSKFVDDADFKVRHRRVVWHSFDVNIKAEHKVGGQIKLGDVELKKDHFVHICDAYKSIWYGHKRMKKLSSYDAPVCVVKYPSKDTSYVSKKKVYLLKDDTRDRDVIHHEYAHFIQEYVLPYDSHGYGYNDDTGDSHSKTSKEFYNSAWQEAIATFMSCAINDDPHYHDGYDASLDQKLNSDNTTVGPHSEGSIQEALWRIYKVHNVSFKDGFWKAFSDTSKGKATDVFKFFNNWKKLKLTKLDKVVESYKKFGMQYGYKHHGGGSKFTAVAAPKKFDKAKKQFVTLDELYNEFGKLGGGTKAEYLEEFYNQNKHFNKNTLAAGSTIAAPKVTAGKKYIIPERFEVKV